MTKVEIATPRKFSGLAMTVAIGEREMFQKDRGFTVIELIVVIAIIFVLAGALLPVLSKAREMAKRTRAREEIHQLEVALRMYGEDWGRYPDDDGNNPPNGCGNLMEWLLKGEYYQSQDLAEGDDLLDPWENAYRYRYKTAGTLQGGDRGMAYNIWSLGPDISDDNDDITNW